MREVAGSDGAGGQRQGGEARRRAGEQALRDPHRPGAGARPVLDAGAQRRVRLRDRAVGLREVDAALVDGGAAWAELGPHPAGRAGGAGAAPADRHGVPGGEPAALAQPRTEHRAAVRDQAPGGGPAADRAAPGRGRAQGVREQVSARAVGRDAAAGGDRAGTVGRPLAAVDGRAVRGAGCLHAGRDEPADPADSGWRRGRRSSSSPTRSRRPCSWPTGSS